MPGWRLFSQSDDQITLGKVIPMNRLYCLLTVLMLQVPAHAQPAQLDEPTGFKTNVTPFLKKHCLSCHGVNEPKGEFQVHDLLSGNFDPADAERWQNILEMVETGDMPPDKRSQPTLREREALKAAVNRQLEDYNVGKNAWEIELPRYANRVDHNALFSGEHKGPAYTAARVWRISGDIYQRLMKDFDLGFDFIVPLQRNNEGFHDYSRLYADEATIRTMTQNAKRVATAMVNGRLTRPKRGEDPTRHVKGFAGTKHIAIKEFLEIEGEPTRAQTSEVMAFVLEYLTKLKPTKQEIDRWVNELLAPNVDAGGVEAGLKGTIVAVLLSPEFLFRIEVGQGKTLPDGRRMLSSTELAFALSYTLHNHPVKTVLDSARQGQLESRSDVESVFRALYDNPKLLRGRTAAGTSGNVWQTSKDHRFGTYSRPHLVQFFQQFFEYTKAPDVFKDDLRHAGKHDPDKLVKDADWTVLHILSEDKNVLEELLTTDRFAVKEGRFKRSKKDPDARVFFNSYSSLAAYNLTKSPQIKQGVAMTEMPAGQRSGMLTHPAWLVAHSNNFHTDPVRRGKWILGHLLGYDVPELPISVQAQLPEWHDKTIRQRFAVVKANECWRCHKKMNPLGDPFEAYDDFGRYRKEHLVGPDGKLVESAFEIPGENNDTNKRRNSPPLPTPKISVDTTGQIFGTGDSNLDGPVKDVNELMNKLAKSVRVRQVFIRHVFRYFMGRNETLKDSPTLMAMDKAYVTSGGSFKETLVALVISDSFLYRK